MATNSPSSTGNRLDVVRSAATGAATLIALFVLCWGPAAAGFFNVTHMYISLFTAAEVTSTTALGEGLGWSTVFGAIGGALVAAFFNLFSFLARP